MQLGFNSKYVHPLYYTCFSSEEAFEDALDELLVATPEQAKQHEKLDGRVRVPQETVPVKNDDGSVVEGSRNGDGVTIKAEDVACVEQRIEVRQRIMDFIRAQKIDVTKLSETVFFLECPGDMPQPQVYETLKSFTATLFDFLDYIVPIVSDDRENSVRIRNLVYATHYHRIDGKRCVKIISETDLDVSFLKQLWTVYLEYLRSREDDEKEGEEACEK